MLIELTSPVFKEKGKKRPAIHFKEGLNVILGKEDGENSIGKSSALLAIDFAFGGNTYLESDGVKHLGDHGIYFAYRFDGKEYYFIRYTSQAGTIYPCTKDYKHREKGWSKAKFCQWLKEQYHMDFAGLSFRESVGSFFRVYGKDNAQERNPLKGIPRENMEKAIRILIKLFDQYKDMEGYEKQAEEQKKQLTIFRDARKYDFISNLVGGIRQYERNCIQMADLQAELDNLPFTKSYGTKNVDIEKARQKEELQGRRLYLESELQALKRQMKLVDMNIKYGVLPTNSDMVALQEYFPAVNIRKLQEVERYHQKLAKNLEGQFQAEKVHLQNEIEAKEKEWEAVKKEMDDLGIESNYSKEFLDAYTSIQEKINALKIQNEAWLTLQDLQDGKKKADDRLKAAANSILAAMEREINDIMKRFNDSLSVMTRNAPCLHFRAYNSYTFETPDDTGTGTNYKGMVLYDLAILHLTALPVIGHDSFIAKNISDEAIDGIMKIYAKSNKQIFIAFDKQNSYRPDTKRILHDHAVLRLSDDGGELYGESWSKKR